MSRCLAWHLRSTSKGKTALSKNGWLLARPLANGLRMEQGWCKLCVCEVRADRLQLCSYTREAYLPEAIINLPAARSDPQVSKNSGRGWIFCD